MKVWRLKEQMAGDEQPVAGTLKEVVVGCVAGPTREGRGWAEGADQSERERAAGRGRAAGDVNAAPKR